jgi:hypothetical protein
MGNNVSWQSQIPYEVTLAYIRTMSNKPIISVGSGIGEFEKKIEKELNLSIICVDPQPTSFNDIKDDDAKNMHLPDFAHVDDLIKTKPHLVGQCHLLLLWSTPNESYFDIEAIAKLKPIDIMIIYETLGGAGGRQMHLWLESIGAPNGEESNQILQTQHNYIQDIQKNIIPYKLQCVYEVGTRSFADQTFCVALISQEKKNCEKLPQRSYTPQKINDDYNKILIDSMFKTINGTQ